MGISMQLGLYSSFIIHTCPERQVLGNSSLLFGNDEVGRNLSAVVGKIRELLENARNIIPQ